MLLAVNCQATYIGETGRNLNERLEMLVTTIILIAEHHLKTNHRIDWDDHNLPIGIVIILEWSHLAKSPGQNSNPPWF